MLVIQHLTQAINAAISAGQAILEIYNRDFKVAFKEDASPLTEADAASDQIIKERLSGSFPILSEEGKSIPYGERKNWKTFWLIDPLDGTKEFIKKNGEFTVNIALITRGKPVLGVVYVPVTGVLYFAADGLGAYRYEVSSSDFSAESEEWISQAQKLNGSELPATFTIVASRSHLSPETEAFIEDCRKQHGTIELISKGSSLKLCLIAEGKANVYPRVAPTMEWDTAAAHAVAKYAGCQVLDFYERTELIYNKENLLNPHFLVTR